MPVDTPDDVVEKLTDALAVALEDRAVIDQMADLGTAPVPPEEVTPQAHASKLRSRSSCGRPIIEDAGVTGS